jgi:gluconokinase
MIHSEATLAVDIGSSSVRASLFTSDGREIPGRRAAVPVAAATAPDGRMEFDPETLFHAFSTVVSRTLRAAPAPDIVAVGVSAFWHSLMGVARDGTPTTPVYAWGDMRPAPAARALASRLDEAAAQARTGCRFHASYWPAKLLWLKTDAPTLFAETRRWLSFSDWIAERLFGTPSAGISMASGTGLLDQVRRAWDHPILAALGVPESKLPVLDDAAAGDLRADFAAAWPELRSARFFPALGDGAAGAVGGGCHDASRLAVNVGTTAALRLPLPFRPEALAPLHAAGLWSYRIDDRRALVGGALSNAGNMIAWLRRTLNLPTARLSERLAALPPDAHGLTLLPFFAGERSPGWAADAGATLHGVRFDVEPIHVLRAALETIALRLAWIAENLERTGAIRPDALCVASGGGVSPVFAQILADALGKPVIRAEIAEASLSGAARVALERLGRLAPGDSAAPPPVGARHSPDPDAGARYRVALRRHQDLYARLVASPTSR